MDFNTSNIKIADIVDNSDKIKCAICLNSESKYTCPKCGIVYCSVNCYKSEKHILCSEDFYKDRVIEELKTINTDELDRDKMINILRRTHAEDLSDSDIDTDDDSIPDLSERLQGIDLNDADNVWKCLTDEEKNEFEQLLSSGDIIEVIPEFVPWWNKWCKKKVEDYDEFLKRQKEYISYCPQHVELKTNLGFTKSKASPMLMWNIVNALASYVYTVRYYMGELSNFQCDSTRMIISLSSSLSKNNNFPSKSLAIESVSQNIINTADVSSNENIELMKDDVESLLNGPNDQDKTYYILSALSDVHTLFTKSLKSKEQCNGNKNGEFSKKFPTALPLSVDRKLVRQCIKKIEYYLAWLE